MDIPLGSRPKPNRIPQLLGLMVVLGLAGALYLGFRVGSPPEVSIAPQATAIGKTTAVLVRAREPARGLVKLTVALVQGDSRIDLVEESFAPQSIFTPWGPKTDEADRPLRVGKDHQPSLQEGPATIEVVATGASTWLFAGPETVERSELIVRLKPPSLSITASEIYVTQGGAEAVTYSVGATAVRHGVKAGRWFFPGFPHPRNSTEKVALFAVPYDMDNADGVVVFAEDDVGNRVERAFITLFKPKPYHRDVINVSKSVMRAVVPKIRAQTLDLPDKGDLVENYIQINRDLRRRNNKRLEGLAEKTQPKFLWKESFVQMPAKVFSSFADRRSYRHEGQEIDQQDHLGFDLASVKQAEIPAANDGIVVLSEYLGIYGNAVVIDHGLGLMSLYAHCSSTRVEVGDRVTRGQTIGRTGATGLALGDHLHFTMLLSGLPVTPLEWWDAHWIRDRIARKLPGVFIVGGE